MAHDAASQLVPSRMRRVRRFLADVVALFSIIGVAGVCVMFCIALWMWNDVSPAGGLRLRLVTPVFFFRVFQFHIGTAVLIAAAVCWFIRYRRVGTATTLLAIVMLLPLLRHYVPKSPPVMSGSSLRIVSANLFSQNRDEASIVRAIRDADADVIVLLEVTPWSYSLLRREFGATHRYEHRPRYNGGGMVMSRVPFREATPPVQLPSNHTRVPLVFELDGRELAIYPVHLVSPGSLRLIAQNREQIRELLKIDAAEARPMVIVGDCNMTPLTSNFGALREAGFRNTHQLIGWGAGNTWGPSWWRWLNRMPGVQIDQIILQRGLTARSHRVGLDTGSDHRPVIAEIGFEDRPRGG